MSSPMLPVVGTMWKWLALSFYPTSIFSSLLLRYQPQHQPQHQPLHQPLHQPQHQPPTSTTSTSFRPYTTIKPIKSKSAPTTFFVFVEVHGFLRRLFVWKDSIFSLSKLFSYWRGVIFPGLKDNTLREHSLLRLMIQLPPSPHAIRLSWWHKDLMHRP